MVLGLAMPCCCHSAGAKAFGLPLTLERSVASNIAEIRSPNLSMAKCTRISLQPHYNKTEFSIFNDASSNHAATVNLPVKCI